MQTLITILLVLVSLILIALVLLQPGKSAGLSGSIAGGAEMLMGKKAKGLEAKLNNYSTIAAVLFLILAIAVNILK